MLFSKKWEATGRIFSCLFVFCHACVVKTSFCSHRVRCVRVYLSEGTMLVNFIPMQMFIAMYESNKDKDFSIDHRCIALAISG